MHKSVRDFMSRPSLADALKTHTFMDSLIFSIITQNECKEFNSANYSLSPLF